MKKSYYKLAKLFHPDRVATTEREEAKEKFNIIHTAYSILSDASKKHLYDHGTNVLFTKIAVAARWENFLRPVCCDEMNNANQRYQGSNTERKDIIREIQAGKGSMTHLLNNIPFMRIEDEIRITEIVKDLIDKGEIPKIPIKKIRK